MTSSPFPKLFGVPPESVKELCVLIPFPLPALSEKLGAGAPAKGKIYSTFSGPQLTLICAPMGAAFCGDAVLWLKDTPCRRVIFVGSCGSLKDPDELPLGSIVIPERCYDLEGFSSLLSGVRWNDAHLPDSDLFSDVSSLKTCQRILPVQSATLGSLAQEQRLLPELQSQGIAVVDMECSAVYAAGNSAAIKTLSLLFVSDYLQGKSFFEPKTAREKEIISTTLKQVAEIILNLTA